MHALIRILDMTSPKKKKGQQRKAAKNQAMADYGVSSNRELAAKVEAEAKFVEDVGRARDLQTRGLAVDINDYANSGFMLEQVPIQVHKRALPHVLNFLKRCDQETFAEVVASVGGDLVSPNTWIEVLLRTMEYEPGCGLQIAENIGPLVRCMSADAERLFFTSNKHWIEGIKSFVLLVYNLVRYSAVEKEVLNALLQQNGLFGSIVQWSFWADHRPDILEELVNAACGNVVKFGENTIRMLISIIYQRNKNWLEKVGTTPIVSKAYDSTCMISYAEGLIQQMKTNGFDVSDLQTIQQLIIGIDCVDKGVITETVDLGLNFTTEFTYAFSLALALIPIMRPGAAAEISDTRVAFAIRAGLIEMYLYFIDRFEENDSFADESYVAGMKSSLCSTIRLILKDVHLISLHQKTAKAIRSKRGIIEKELGRLQQNTSITSNVKCRELLDVVRATLSLSGSYCCRCNKSLSKTEVKQCNGCHRMSYCSRVCQKEDWLNGGHKVACCKSFTDELAGQFQGMLMPRVTPENERAALKLKELETNLNMIQLKLFLDNSVTILSQASSLNTPLHDCIVKFDLRECPPIVELYKNAESYTTTHKMGFEKTRSKENITCVYAASNYNGEMGESQILFMQRFFPHEWLSKQNGGRSSSL